MKIDRSEVPDRDHRGRNLGPLAQALLAGDTVFVPGPSKSIGGCFYTLRNHGYRVRRRTMTRNGIEGIAAWAEKIEPQP